ncbi:lamin tail domain-containing protein [Streptomyces sp. CO7]
MRRSTVRAALLAAVSTIALGGPTAAPAHAAEYQSALKIRGAQYDAPGADRNSCTSGNTSQEYLTLKNYSKTATINLRGYVVEDAAGNSFTFTASHSLQPGDYIRLRGGNGSDSDAKNVVYRDNCNFMWNNDRDTIYLYKPSGPRSDVHAYSRSGNDGNGDGYIGFHG